jgi:membrane protein
MRKESAIEQVELVYGRLNDLSGGVLGILGEAIRHFNEADASSGAASIAYYALFSIFPLVLALIAAGSYFLQKSVVQHELLNYVRATVPVSESIIEKNIQKVLELRGPVGIIALISLFWSASGVFGTLADHINRAWPEASLRGFVQSRLVALSMVGGVGALLILSLAMTAALGLLASFSVPLGGDVSIYGTSVWKILSNLIPWLVRVCAFFALYRWVPNAKVKWPAALWGAVVAALGWEAITAAFTWYLRSGLAQYELVYGSLGTLVALIFWIYLSSWIALFGAHLSAAVARASNKPDSKESKLE